MNFGTRSQWLFRMKLVKELRKESELEFARERRGDSARTPGEMEEDRAAHLSSLLPEDKGA